MEVEPEVEPTEPVVTELPDVVGSSTDRPQEAAERAELTLSQRTHRWKTKPRCGAAVCSNTQKTDVFSQKARCCTSIL